MERDLKKSVSFVSEDVVFVRTNSEKKHKFVTSDSHPQCCDNLYSFTDDFVFFANRQGVFILNLETNKATRILRVSSSYSMCAWNSCDGVTYVCAGKYGFTVCALKRDEKTGVIKKVAEARSDEDLMTNFLRFSEPRFDPSVCILSRAINSRKGIKQYKIALSFDEEGKKSKRRLCFSITTKKGVQKPQLSVECVLQVSQPDYCNCALPKTLFEDSYLVCVNDGSGGKSYKLDQSSGLIIPESEKDFSYVFRDGNSMNEVREKEKKNFF